MSQARRAKIMILLEEFQFTCHLEPEMKKFKINLKSFSVHSKSRFDFAWDKYGPDLEVQSSAHEMRMGLHFLILLASSLDNNIVWHDVGISKEFFLLRMNYFVSLLDNLPSTRFNAIITFWRNTNQQRREKKMKTS